MWLSKTTFLLSLLVRNYFFATSQLLRPAVANLLLAAPAIIFDCFFSSTFFVVLTTIFGVFIIRKILKMLINKVPTHSRFSGLLGNVFLKRPTLFFVNTTKVESVF